MGGKRGQERLGPTTKRLFIFKIQCLRLAAGTPRNTVERLVECFKRRKKRKHTLKVETRTVQ